MQLIEHDLPRHEAYCHADVYEQVHEQATGYAISIYPGETLPASFGIMYDPPYHKDVQYNDDRASQETPFFPYSTEYEIRALFRNEPVSCLGASEVALAHKTSRSDGYHALIDVVPDSGGVLFHSEQHLNPFPLVVLQYVVENEISGEHQYYAGDEPQRAEQHELVLLPV